MTLLGESFPNEQYQIGSEQFRQARRHEDVWGSRDSSTHSFLSVSWFIEFACDKKTRNNVDVSGYGLLGGSDTELTWPA
jgi:hypothetical protein